MAEKKTTQKSNSSDNAKRVAKAVSKYDTSKSFGENADAVLGVVGAAVKSSKKSTSKGAKGFYKFVAVALVLALVAVALYGYLQGWFPITPPPDPSPTPAVGGEVNVHFLELGNKYTGDCTLIDIGDTEILIDAGSLQTSAPTICNYIDRYCSDGILEYVIATHAHRDHIAGFVGTKQGSNYNGVLYKYQVGTLIQFALTDSTATSTNLYGMYVSAVEGLKAQGTNVYTALQCWKEIDGAKKSYQIADGISFEILYTRYYEQKSSDENNYSVCILFKQGTNNYLFTGDLEKEGEASLVQSNTLPEVELFKGGHHGSPTSTTDELLSVIKPKCVCVCCCAGSVKYTQTSANTFPSQAFIDRVAPYTDKVYVTTMGITEYDSTEGEFVDKGFTSMNGNIVFTCKEGLITVTGSNNSLKLKETAWFKDNRDCPDAWKE